MACFVFLSKKMQTGYENYSFGVKQKLILFRHSKLFSVLTNTLIIVYSILLGVRSYAEQSSQDWVYFTIKLLDYGITIFFLFEILLRMYASPSFKVFFRDWWNVFDLIVILIALIPVQESDLSLLARLLRVVRTLRLISFNSELKKLIGVLYGALPSILNIVILMFVLFYIFAVIGNALFARVNPELWGDISISMLTLFRILTFEGWADVMYEAMEVFPYAWIYFIAFIVINGFVIFNLFIAVLIDEINETRAINVEHFAIQEISQNNQIIRRTEELKQDMDELKRKLDALAEKK